MYTNQYNCQGTTEQAHSKPRQPSHAGWAQAGQKQPNQAGLHTDSTRRKVSASASPAQPGQTWYGIWYTQTQKTMEILDFPENTPSSPYFGGRSAGGYFLRLNNSRATEFCPPNIRFRRRSPFSKKNLQILSILGNHDFAKKLQAKHKHTHIKLIDEAMCPSKSIDLVLDHSFCAFDGPVLWF